MKNKTVCKAIILVELFLLTSPLMSTDPNDVQKFLREPILSTSWKNRFKKLLCIDQLEKELPWAAGAEKKVDSLLLKIRTDRVAKYLISDFIQHELKERGVSRRNQRIAQYLTSGAFLTAANLPAEESGKVSKKIVGIIVKQIGVDEAYQYVVDRLELDYPECIKKRQYLHKLAQIVCPLLAQIVCPLIVKMGMHIVLNSIISKVEDPAGMRNHYKNVYK